jgi:hypothetical protein
MILVLANLGNFDFSLCKKKNKQEASQQTIVPCLFFSLHQESKVVVMRGGGEFRERQHVDGKCTLGDDRASLAGT